MKLKTNKLLLISAIIILVTFIAAIFWQVLGLTGKHTPILAITIMVAFGFNIAGFILGVTERKANRKKALIGIIGHLLLMTGFVILVAYSFLSMKN